MSPKDPSIMQVQKGHTCISIGLIGLDIIYMCDKCKKLNERIDGIIGHCPAKNAKPKYENLGISQVE